MNKSPTVATVAVAVAVAAAWVAAVTAPACSRHHRAVMADPCLAAAEAGSGSRRGLTVIASGLYDLSRTWAAATATTEVWLEAMEAV